MRSGQMRDAFIAAGKMGQDLSPGRVGQGGEGAVERARLIFNHLVKYLAGRLGHANFFFGLAILLQKLGNRAGSGDNWPRCNRKKSAEGERFNRKLPMIFTGKKVSRELPDGPATGRCCGSTGND